MTPEEIPLLAQVGQVLIVNISNAVIGVVLWTLHATTCTLAMISLWNRQHHPSLKFQLAMLAVILLISTYSEWTNFAQLIQIQQLQFIGHPQLTSLDDRIAFSNEKVFGVNWQYFVATFLTGTGGFSFLIGDAVVVWRTWKTWMQSKVFLALPIFLIIVAFALGVTSNAVDIVFRVHRSNPTDHFVNVFNITGITAACCSIAANGIATGMVGFQAFQHRKDIRDTIGHQNSRVWRIMLFLTEIGVVYLVIQTICVILNATPYEFYTPHDYVNIFWLKFSQYVSMTYPAIVILMVAHNKSLANDIDIGISGQVGLTDVGTHILCRQGPASFPSLTLRGSRGVGAGSSQQYSSTFNGGPLAETGSALARSAKIAEEGSSDSDAGEDGEGKISC